MRDVSAGILASALLIFLPVMLHKGHPVNAPASIVEPTPTVRCAVSGPGSTTDWVSQTWGTTRELPPVGFRTVLFHRPSWAEGEPVASLDPRLPRQVLMNGLGRTDRGLLLLTNDARWAVRLRPRLHALPVSYLVRIGRQANEVLTARLERGVTDQGDFLSAQTASIATGLSGADWLEVTVAPAGRASLRRLLGAFGIPVFEVVRTAIGPLNLGDLPVNCWRDLTSEESTAIGGPAFVR